MAKPQEKPTVRVFPTPHPFVKNEDGSMSNVKMATVTFGEAADAKHYVIPTMVGGKLLPLQDAIEVARTFGLDRYPVFKDLTEAEKWAQLNHGNISETGWLLKQ